MLLYESTTTNFTKNGLGYLTEAISAKVTETLNGDEFLEMTYPLNGALADDIVEDNIIKCNVGNNNYQLFRIKRVIKTFSTMIVYAPHIFYDLLDNMLADTYPQNLACASFGTWILNNTNFATNFTFSSDIGTTATARYVRKNPVEAIMGTDENSMVNLFGGELERDNFTIKLNATRGADNGYRLIVGKNITEIRATIDTTGIVTRLLPVAFDGMVLPETYVDSPIIGNYRTPRIQKVEMTDITYDENGVNGYATYAECYQAMRDRCNAMFDGGLDKPSINIEVNWIELSKTAQYKAKYSYLERVNLGDTITAQVLGIDYTTRVIKTVYNVLLDMIETFEIGTLKPSITTQITNNTASVTEAQTINVVSILANAQATASAQLTSALGGYVYKTNSELYIMDTDDPSTAQKVWRWNMNGLGYSSTGINGTYTTAMTQDGQILGSLFAAETIETTAIKGYGSITAQIQDLEDKTTYITADTDGLHIQKDGDAYASHMTTSGFSVTNGGNTVMTANSDGVSANNFLVDGDWNIDTMLNNTVLGFYRR